MCKLEDVMVTLKLSSTVFESAEGGSSAVAAATETAVSSPGAAAHGSGGTVFSRTGESYFFDKNGAIIPYSAFVSLLDSEEFHNYLKSVKHLYTGKLHETENDDDNTDDDDEVVVRAKKKKRSEIVKKMRYGKAKRAIEFESDNETDAPVDGPKTPPAELSITPLPSDDNEEEEEYDNDERRQDPKASSERGEKEEDKTEERKTRKRSQTQK